MVGRSPVGTRPFGDWDDSQVARSRAPIVPVISDLRNFDGSPRYYIIPDGTQGPRMILDPTQFAPQVLASPVFSPSRYRSSWRPTQFTDAVQRAQFYNTAGPGWHSLLVPVVAQPRTMVLIRGSYPFNVDSTGHLRSVLVDENVFGGERFPPTAAPRARIATAAGTGQEEVALPEGFEPSYQP